MAAGSSRRMHMLQRICLYTATALTLLLPGIARAQSSSPASHPKPRPATVVRPGGTRAGIAPPPRDHDDHARFRTPRHREGFDEGPGVVVGSYGHVPGERRRGRECYESRSNDATPAGPSAPVQPQVRQPVVSQPQYGGMAPAPDDSATPDNDRLCSGRGH